ncbi:facilitated trehalose transporter Tret1-like [Asbolus verrucosus]|uniref:Facilitated trehalose transporter Tret1-like n=1 Tax=Asbolus verrucosus TaxID=1661398 RepID=A0A482VHD2_ASBVE|nr:facilitated trehalose transporter Tret1-like [Asbolus verrucosus]
MSIINPNEKNGRKENKTWPQYLAVLTALLSMFCSGIHFGWPSPSLPRIFSDEYPFNVTAEEASYITIIGPVGDVAGNILSSLLVDLIGRKWTILLIGAPQITSMTMIYLSTYSPALLYAARFIGGISEGACFTVLPIYICEVSEPKVRGLLGSSFSLILMFGILFVNIIGSYVTLYTAALIFLCCSVLFLVTFSQMPESPYYLLMKNRVEEARSSLQRLRAREDVDAELASLTSDVRRQMAEKGRFRDLLTIRSNRTATVVMVILRFLQQFSGVSSFTFYAQLLFKEATDAIPQHWAAILMMVIQAIFTLIAVLVVDVVGRKPMILTSIGGCCLSLVFNAVFFGVRDWSDVDVSSLTVLPLVGLIVFMVFFASGLGSAVNLLLGELFPAAVKAKAACIMNVVFSVSMVVSSKFYQYMADTYSLAIPFAFFALVQSVGFVFCFRLVPETMNKSLEQIQQELKGNREDKNRT